MQFSRPSVPGENAIKNILLRDPWRLDTLSLNSMFAVKQCISTRSLYSVAMRTLESELNPLAIPL